MEGLGVECDTPCLVDYLALTCENSTVTEQLKAFTMNLHNHYGFTADSLKSKQHNQVLLSLQYTTGDRHLLHFPKTNNLHIQQPSNITIHNLCEAI